jgi:hypothetical protein
VIIDLDPSTRRVMGRVMERVIDVSMDLSMTEM